MSHDNSHSDSDSNKPPDSLLELQQRFAGHLRNPEEIPSPDGVEDRRMAIYRRLFFGNLRNLMAKNFPVLRRLVDDDRWDGLIRHFMAQHRAQTPMFTEIGREFVRFIENTRPDGLPEFAAELVHWEYLETVVRLHEADVAATPVDESASLIDDIPVINPTLQISAYRWPVHQIGPEFQPEHPLDQPLVLAACRRRNHRVAFMRFNPVTGRLIELLRERPDQRGKAVLGIIAKELNSTDLARVIRSGEQMLAKLTEGEFLLGARGTSV